MDETLRQLSRKALEGDSDAAFRLYGMMSRNNQIASQKVSYSIDHDGGTLEIILVAPELYFNSTPDLQR